LGKAVWLDGEFWIMGGEAPDASRPGAFDASDRVDIYDPTTNHWRSGPSLGVARAGLCTTTYEGFLIAAGGTRQAAFGPSTVLEMLWPRPRP